MKILYISPYFPSANSNYAGVETIYSIFNFFLKEYGNVELISFATAKELEQYNKEYRKRFIFSYVKKDKSILEKITCQLLAWFKWKHVKYTQLSHLKRIILEKIKHDDFDVIFVETSKLLNLFIDERPSMPVIVNLHDLEIKNNIRESIKGLTHPISVKHINDEIKLLEKASKVVCPSYFEEKYLNAIAPKVNSTTIKHIFFLAKWKQVEDKGIERIKNSILLAGAMNRRNNIDAVKYFLNGISPLLELSNTQYTFYVQGANPPESLLKNENKNCKVLGYVEDFALLFRKCKCFVFPSLEGGGLLFKILQAMSFGLPVITNTIGNESIGAIDGENILIANTEYEFFNHITRLFNDKEYWDMLSTNSIQFVNKNFDSSISFNQLKKLLESFSSN